MEAYRIVIKLYIDNADKIDREAIVPVFHKWIQEQGLSGHLLIDVADYLHVAHGPGVVLISHEANLALDDTDGRTGLLYQRKRPFGHGFADRLATAFGATLEAASRLEMDPGHAGAIKFRTDEVSVRIADKLHAPNVPGTLDAIRADLQGFFEKIYGGEVKIEQRVDATRPFEVRVRADGAPSLMDLIDRAAVASVG